MELFKDKWRKEKRYSNNICQKYSVSKEEIWRYFFSFQNRKLFNEFQELIFERCIHLVDMPKFV